LANIGSFIIYNQTFLIKNSTKFQPPNYQTNKN